jgi:hypothetical protein
VRVDRRLAAHLPACRRLTQLDVFSAERRGQLRPVLHEATGFARDLELGLTRHDPVGSDVLHDEQLTGYTRAIRRGGASPVPRLSWPAHLLFHVRGGYKPGPLAWLHTLSAHGLGVC